MSIKVVHSGPDTIKVSVETTPEVKVSNPVVNVVNVTGVVGGGGGTVSPEYPQTIAENVKNVSGRTLLKGTPVHVTGSVGNLAEVIAADAATNYPAHFVLNEDLDDEQEGLGIALGFINNVNVPDASIYTEGQTVYLGAEGGWVTEKPTGTNAIQNLGIILKVNTSGNKISGIVMGAGRSNDLPNIPENNIWVGDENGVPVAESYVFSQDYVLNIPDQNGVSKSFGKYLNGDTVPAQGKTAMEVMIDAFQDTVNPEPSITGLSQPEYGRGNFSDTVTLDFGILNNTTVSGTEGVSAVLEWGVNGYGVGYGGGSFTYDNTQVYFNASTVNKTIEFTTAYSASNNYQVRLTVTEPGTDGGEATSTVLNASGSNNWDVSIFTISFTGTTGLDSVAGLDESTTRRIRGNNASTLNIAISSKEPSYVNIYQIRVYGHASSSTVFSANSLEYDSIINDSSADISPTFTPSGNLSVYRYKVEVEDEHGFVTSQISSTINFYYETYYGLSSNSSYDVSMLTPLTADLFTSVPGGIDGIGPFDNIGQNTYVWIIYPSTTGITEISDGAELITGGFTRQSNVSITGLSGFATTYSVYRSNATGSFDNITLYIT